MNFQITALNHDETTEVRTLFSSVFNHLIDAEKWDWKYAQGPRLGSINLVARTPEGELIGHIGCVLFQGIYKDQPLVFAQACDVMVSRHVRGGLDAFGVYAQLIKALQEALRKRVGEVFAYGFPGVRPFKLGERMGFYRRLYPVHASRFEHGNTENPGLRMLTIVPADWNCTRLDVIWKRLASHQKEPVLIRTGAYLVWRYATHPERSYRLWVLKRFWKDVGWLIISSMPNNEEVIVDSLLPSQITVDTACNLLWKKLKKVHQPVTAIVHWLGPYTQSTKTNGIVAGELQVGPWHTHFPNPCFQPGDTDVF